MGNSSAGAATLSQLCGAVTPGLADANAQRRAFAPPGLCIQPILLSTVSFLFCSAALSAVPDTGSGLLLPQRLHRVTTATGPDRRRRVVGGALSTAVLRAAAHPARHPRGGSNSLHHGSQSPAWPCTQRLASICTVNSNRPALSGPGSKVLYAEPNRCMGGSARDVPCRPSAHVEVQCKWKERVPFAHHRSAIPAHMCSGLSRRRCGQSPARVCLLWC